MKRVLVLVLTAILMLSVFPAGTFADGQSVRIKCSSNVNATVGEVFYFEVRSTSSTNDPYKIVINPESKDLEIKSGTSGIITSTEKVSTLYTISASEKAKEGTVKMMVQAVGGDGSVVLQEEEVIVHLENPRNRIDGSGQGTSDVIYQLSSGDYLESGKIETLVVSVYNRSSFHIREASIEIATPQGITIQSGSTKRSVGVVSGYSNASASFPITVDKDVVTGSYPFEVKLSGITISTEGGVAGTAPKDISATIYIPVLGKEEQEEEPESDVATPILMVSSYDYGASRVAAGGNCKLNLGILNTSSINLRNIKVTVNSADNAFIPKGSSNSFYISEIKAGQTAEHSMELSCLKDAAQGPHSVTVSMTYEDGQQHSYSSDDTISVLVSQQLRLVVDDVMDPGWLTMSDTGYVNVDFRNMGNNVIRNLTVQVEGDFTVDGSTTYYVGNLESGRSDSYSVNFFPMQAGPCNGSFTFTYEDADGATYSMVKDFVLNIGEGYVWDDPGVIDPEPLPAPGLSLGAKIGIGAGALAALIACIVIAKKRKQKKQEALELDE